MRRHPGSVSQLKTEEKHSLNLIEMETQQTYFCLALAEPIKKTSSRTILITPHNLGFIVQPAIKPGWERHGDEASFSSLPIAAASLASRYDDCLGLIRSWDRFMNAHHNPQSMGGDFLVIIDILCSENLSTKLRS